jgi:hypothetical protein
VRPGDGIREPHNYAELILINNTELDLPNMWIASIPMFIGGYVETQWLESNAEALSLRKDLCDQSREWEA